MIINHNVLADFANKTYNINTKNSTKNMRKLSSGFRVNSAADDAAGLQISEKMRQQVRGLNRASHNAEDGISYIQTAEGALNEVHAMLDRCKELTVQAANDTNTDADREAIKKELDELVKHIDQVADTTQFNTMNVFSTTGISPDVTAMPDIDVPGTVNARVKDVNVTFFFVDSSGNPIDVTENQAVGVDNNYENSDIARFVQAAAADAVANLKSTYPSLFTNASDGIKIGLNMARMDGVGGTLASAALGMTASSTYTTMSYTLNVDTADYPMSDFATMSDSRKADLAATIAHEMTHLVMYDNLTNGMLSGRTTSYPDWFIEGMAQTASGDGGWVTGSLRTSSSDATIQQYMNKLPSHPYGAGYLATMYLGYAASTDGRSGAGSTETDPTALGTLVKEGLNKIFDSLSTGATLSDAIAANTNFSGLADFEAKFRAGDTDSLGFVKNFITAVNGGGGSIFGPLNTAQSAMFEPSTLTSNLNKYVVDASNTRFMNAYGSGYTFPEKEQPKVTGPDVLNLQVGALAYQSVKLYRYDVSSVAILGTNNLDVSDFEKAGQSIERVDKAIERVSNVRSYYGAVQNRLEYAINNLDNTAENTQAAESRIRDTDMASEVTELSKNNILQQAAQAMIAQANSINEGVLTLLQ